MNKELGIKKINKIGKIGKIITVIILCLTIASMVGTVFGGIVFAVAPKDAVSININTTVEADIDASKLGETITEAEKESIENSLINKSFVDVSAGGQEFELEDIKVDGNIVKVASKPTTSTMTFKNILVVCVIILVSEIATIVSLVYTKKLCSAFEKCSSPFEANVINKMRNFAFSLIPWAFLSSLPQMAISNLFNNGINLTFDFNFGVVLVVLIILGLTYIFKYGAVLQQESDETL